MSVSRQLNLLGQQRVDIPHLRSLESSLCADFDLLAGTMLAGGQALILKGFTLVTTGAIGAAATSLELAVAGGLLLHVDGSASGTIFQVEDDADNEVLSSTNTKVDGSFTASAVNYVGLDLERAVDDDTADLVQFLDADSETETPRTVALARTLSYRIVVSTTDFASTPHVCPIAKVTTSSSGVVTAIEDARQLAFRLGSGGSFPDKRNAYAWPGGRRENTSGDVFSGGDKALDSFKAWQDAVMTRLWELGGGEFWYGATADRDVRMTRGGATFTNGEHFEWDGTHLHWKGVKFVFAHAQDSGGSAVYYNTVSDQTSNSAGLTDLAAGECLYVDLDRASTATLTARKGVLATLGTPDIPGSRYIMAWRVGSDIFTRDGQFAVGTTFNVATTTSNGLVTLAFDASDNGGSDAAPKVPVIDASNRVVGAGLTRGALAAGTLLVGTGANDSNVQIGPATTGQVYLATLNADLIRNYGGITNLDIDPNGTALRIGMTNASGTTVGRSGAPTTLNASTLSLDAATEIQIGVTSSPQTTIGRAGAPTTLNGNAVTLANTSATTTVQGPLSADRNVTVNSSYNYKYSSAITRYAHAAPHDMYFHGDSGANNPRFFYDGLSGYIASKGPGVTNPDVSCRFRVPAGATIKGIRFHCANFDTVSARQLTNIRVQVKTYDAASTSDGYTSLTSLSGAATNAQAAGNQAWVDVEFPGDWVDRTVPDDGWIQVNFFLPSLTNAGETFRVYAVRLEYTLDTVKPQS